MRYGPIVSGTFEQAIDALAERAVELNHRPLSWQEKRAAGISDFLTSIGDKAKGLGTSIGDKAKGLGTSIGDKAKGLGTDLATKFQEADPMAQYGLGGAALGGLLGAGSAAVGNIGKPKEDRRGWLRSALTGALGGGAIGAGAAGGAGLISKAFGPGADARTSQVLAHPVQAVTGKLPAAPSAPEKDETSPGGLSKDQQLDLIGKGDKPWRAFTDTLKSPIANLGATINYGLPLAGVDALRHFRPAAMGEGIPGLRHLGRWLQNPSVPGVNKLVPNWMPNPSLATNYSSRNWLGTPGTGFWQRMSEGAMKGVTGLAELGRGSVSGLGSTLERLTPGGHVRQSHTMNPDAVRLGLHEAEQGNVEAFKGQPDLQAAAKKMSGDPQMHKRLSSSRTFPEGIDVPDVPVVRTRQVYNTNTKQTTPVDFTQNETVHMSDLHLQNLKRTGAQALNTRAGVPVDTPFFKTMSGGQEGPINPARAGLKRGVRGAALIGMPLTELLLRSFGNWSDASAQAEREAAKQPTRHE